MRNNPLREQIEDYAPGFRLEPYYTVPELSSALKIGFRAIYSHINKGHLKAICFGGSWRISQSALDAFIANRNQWMPRGRFARPRNAAGRLVPRSNRSAPASPGGLTPEDTPAGESTTDNSPTT